MADILLIAADLLEKAAAVIDANDAEKTAAVQRERSAAVRLIADKYAESTGEALSVEIIEKLAASSEDIVTTVGKMIEKTAGSVDRMGHVSEKDDGNGEPLTKKDAAAAAWNRFGSFVNS